MQRDLDFLNYLTDEDLEARYASLTALTPQEGGGSHEVGRELADIHNLLSKRRRGIMSWRGRNREASASRRTIHRGPISAGMNAGLGFVEKGVVELVHWTNHGEYHYGDPAEATDALRSELLQLADDPGFDPYADARIEHHVRTEKHRREMDEWKRRRDVRHALGPQVGGLVDRLKPDPKPKPPRGFSPGPTLIPVGHVSVFRGPNEFDCTVFESSTSYIVRNGEFLKVGK